MERTLEVDLRIKREEEERARKRKSVGDSRREEKKERKRRKMAHTHTQDRHRVAMTKEDAKKDTHVPISSAVDKQFTEPGGHKVKLLIPLNSCTPSLGAGALLPTSKMTPRTTGNAYECRTNSRRRDKTFWGRLFSRFSSFDFDDDDARMTEHARLVDGLLETDAERMMRVGLMNGICVSISK